MSVLKRVKLALSLEERGRGEVLLEFHLISPCGTASPQGEAKGDVAKKSTLVPQGEAEGVGKICVKKFVTFCRNRFIFSGRDVIIDNGLSNNR